MANDPERRKAKREAKRNRLYALLGGECVICGTKPTADAALHFHHKDPSTKEFNVARCLSYSMPRLVAEAMKCELLCEECHKAHHRPRPGDPTPADLRAAAALRLPRPKRPAPPRRAEDPGQRRRSITRTTTTPFGDGGGSLSITVSGVGHDLVGDALLASAGPDATTWDEAEMYGGRSYSVSNVTVGEALGPTYTQVSVKLPDDPLGNALAAALADGVGPSISAIAREWMSVGAEKYLASKTVDEPADTDPQEGTTE